MATEDEIARFMSFVEFLESGCWFWTGARSRGQGNRRWYGSFSYRGKVIRAHRFASEEIGGQTCPPGHHRDHKCHFSMCVNPDHIEVVPKEVNQQRKMERKRDRQDRLQLQSCSGTSGGCCESSQRDWLVIRTDLGPLLDIRV